MRDRQPHNPDILQRSRGLLESLLSEGKVDQVIRFFEDNGAELFVSECADSAHLRYLQAKAHSTAAQLPQALRAARQAEVALGRLGETLDLARLYLTLGNILRDMGQIDEAERSYRDAESLFRRNDESVGRGQALNRLAQLSFMRSDWTQAVALLTETLELAKARNDIRRMAFLYGNLGRVRSFMGASREAIDNLTMNIDLSLELNDQIEVARARLSLGYEKLRLRRLAEAEELFAQAEVTIAERGMSREAGILGSYRGELALQRGDFEAAHSSFNEAVRLSDQISTTGDLAARSRRGLAELALAEGRYQRALKYANEATVLFEALGEKIDLGVLARIQAEAYAALDQGAEAMERFDCSLALLDEARASFELAETLECAGRGALYRTHKRLAHLFRAQEIHSRRGDRAGRDRIERYISGAADLNVSAPSINAADSSDRVNAGSDREFLSANPRVKKIIAQLQMIRNGELPVLLTGETGVGKGHLARYFHSLARPDKPFVSLNVTNVPETLLEAELFGRTKGAYTDATETTSGLLEAANGGTLFLDEIGEMPQALQMRLLNVIEEKCFRPLGSTQVIHVDFILITATNRNLKEMVENREFRRDLYHRLDGFTFEIPPLRERKEDIPLLLDYYLNRYGLMLGADSADPELLRRFLAHDWPGNVRELENKVKRMKAMSALVKEGSLVELISGAFDSEQAVESADLFSQMERFERDLIVEALIAANWNKSAAARQLHVHEATLRAKMRRLEISVPSGESGSAERRAG